MITEIIENNLVPTKNYIYGTAELEGLLDTKYNRFQYGIVIGKRLDDKIVDEIDHGPTLGYYNTYKQYNTELAELAHTIKNELQKASIDAVVVEPTINEWPEDKEHYLRTLSVGLSHKMLATRAGLGWIGKTDLFISHDFGPRVRLVSVLIDQKPDIISKPVEKSKCGTCDICVEKCPAQAANGKLWDIHTYRDEFFDAHKCQDMCGNISKKMLNIDTRICGICIAVCPIGTKKNTKTIQE